MKVFLNAKLVFPDEITEGILVTDGPLIREILPADADIPADCEAIDAGGLYLGPGLIDQHLHGYHNYGEGFDIIDNVRGVAMAHLKHGVTSCTPSPSYSLRMDRYLSIIDQCSREIAGENGPSPVIGIHLEGPYINPRQGAGRKYAWKYSDEAFERLFLAGGKNILHCTHAPEMPFADKVQAMINKYGAVMDIGHTEADPESMYRAVKAGAKIITHIFDATGNSKGVHAFDLTGDAQDGVSWVALSIPGLFYELICDKDHVHAAASSQRLLLRTAGEDHVILISDCTYHKRADLHPEDYEEPAHADINMGRDGRLFGSRITVADGAKNFKETTGADVRVTFKCASSNSARALNIYDRFGSIHPGKTADLVLTDEDFTVKDVFFRGERITEVRN